MFVPLVQTKTPLCVGAAIWFPLCDSTPAWWCPSIISFRPHNQDEAGFTLVVIQCYVSPVPPDLPRSWSAARHAEGLHFSAFHCGVVLLDDIVGRVHGEIQSTSKFVVIHYTHLPQWFMPVTEGFFFKTTESSNLIGQSDRGLLFHLDPAMLDNRILSAEGLTSSRKMWC